MSNTSEFYQETRNVYNTFLEEQGGRFPKDEVLKIDLHCHDKNSDVPDELWGRILKLPETWLKTSQLIKTLERNGTDVITVTNHNNARSCWDLLDKGIDVLVGAEFTCHFPDYALSVHVLTYGFTPEQEVQLNKLRHNIYYFARYVREHGIVTVLPHPLFFYTHGRKPSPEILEKLSVLFQRFEVLNGQRGYWQNNLTRLWVNSLTPERIDWAANKHKLDPYDFCVSPYEKSVTGGSDDHNGIFAGRTGTLVHVPDLQEKLKRYSKSELTLEAIRLGNTAPYGELGEEEKLTVTFLDYFSQVAINMQDPGLFRLMLHKGSMKDKLACLAVSNVMQELKRHKYTLTFLKTFHEALSGKKPALLTSLGVSKEFKPALKTLKKIAKTQRTEPDQFLEVIRKGIPDIYETVTHLFFKRLSEHLGKMDTQSVKDITFEELVRSFEIPTQFRALFSNEHSYSKGNITQVNLSKILDDLTFPALASVVIAGASFTSSQVIYSNREFLEELATDLGEGAHPKKALWLTDTFADKNGVSSVLQSTLKVIQEQNYEIDILTCHPDLDEEDHLKIVRPLAQFKLESLGDQQFHVPDLLEIQKIFEQGGYDRVICSTEALMGLIGLYLKTAFSIPAFFFMHTDWMEFAEKTTQLNTHELDRLRRVLRSFYKEYDGIFTLNSDHKEWLISSEMEIDKDKVFMTKHWVDECFQREKLTAQNSEAAPVLLYVGRISEEKGIYDLVSVMERVHRYYPDTRLILAGAGNECEKLKQKMPFAEFEGWVGSHKLKELYEKSDLLILPSKFDTFGCVILEAMSSALPTISYDCKGPKEIINNGRNGFLVKDTKEMSNQIIKYLSTPRIQIQMRQACLRRSKDFKPTNIMEKMLADIGLSNP